MNSRDLERLARETEFDDERLVNGDISEGEYKKRILERTEYNELLEVVKSAYSLGWKMALLHEPFVSPFEDDSMTMAWETGFLQRAYRDGVEAGANASILDCPYKDFKVSSSWCEGLTRAEDFERQKRRMQKRAYKRRKPEWQKVGF